MIKFEIVWIYRGAEYLLARHHVRRIALRDYREGRSRCHVLIHGGRLRLDRVRHA